MAKTTKKKPAPKKAAKKSAPVKKVIQKAQEYYYVTIHWLALNGRTGEMIGMFSHNKGETFSLIKTMKEAVNRLESSGLQVASVTIKTFFPVAKNVAELYMKEKVGFEKERQEVMQGYINDQKAAKEKAEKEKAEKEVAVQENNNVTALRPGEFREDEVIENNEAIRPNTDLDAETTDEESEEGAGNSEDKSVAEESDL